MAKNNGRSSHSPSIVKSGKSSASKVTTETVRTLERAGSWESAKIAREIAKKP